MNTNTTAVKLSSGGHVPPNAIGSDHLEGMMSSNLCSY